MICGIEWLGCNRAFCNGIRLIDLWLTTLFQADRDDGTRNQVILYDYGPITVVEVVLHDGESRSHAPNVFFHRLDSRGESRFLSAFLLGDARTLVCEANGVPVIEYRDHDLPELGMYEILGYFPYQGIRHFPPDEPRLLVDRGREVLYELVGRGGGYLGYSRGGFHIVVQCDARRRVDVRVVEFVTVISGSHTRAL